MNILFWTGYALIMVAFFAFPGLDWRHVVLLAGAALLAIARRLETC